MPKKVATPKQSGGGGYTFEDKVTATYLLMMLAGDIPLRADVGLIEQVRVQNRVDGWYLDDIVLFLKGIDDGTNAVAISVKSNTQLTITGFSEDFVKTIWEQRQHVETDQFDVERDYLALATPPVEAEVQTAWSRLLEKAADADAAEFANRIATPQYSNDIERAILASLHCPSEINATKSADDTVELLKRLRHFQFDFTSEPSTDENSNISKCEQLLHDGGLAEADSLWTHLKQIARSLATSGGELTRTELASRLRATFSLKEFPNYVADWGKIGVDFKDQTDLVRDSLGGKLHLHCDENEKLKSEQSVVALVGASGCGKTVIAKKIARQNNATGHTVWLSASQLNACRLTILFKELDIRLSFPELVAQSVANSGMIVIDRLEQLNKTGLANLALLLRRANIDSNTTTWSFVFTCVVDLWENTLQSIQQEYENRLDVDVIPVEVQFNDHRSKVIKAFPKLARMLQRPHLDPVFRNLKILDLVVSNAHEDTDTANWVGETDILDWYWLQVVDVGSEGVARSRFIQKLACIEADEFLAAVPVGEFDSDECRLSTELIANQMIWKREERFGFEHDLLGDWARTRFLLSRQHEIVAVAQEKVFKPRWHRAIRLYGLRLLENQANDIDKWSHLCHELSPNGNYTVEGDLILESVVYAANVETRLQDVWEILLESDGVLLNRLLTRFLHIATLAVPGSSELPHSAAYAAYNRYPFWPLWGPMLRVLFKNRAIAISLSTSQVTQIAHLWLKYTSDEWSLRDEAAQILLDAAAHMIDELRTKKWHADGDLSEEIFSRLLTASIVRPDEVSNLAIALVERRENSLFLADDFDEIEPEEPVILPEPQSLLTPRRGPVAAPWMDGPSRGINHHVYDGFLGSTDPLQYLFRTRPDICKEILLALLIRKPLPMNRYADSFQGGLREFLHIRVKRDWSPAMFIHGPFLSMLRINSEKGVETIIALVNFATQRWLDNRKEPQASVCASIDGQEYEYFGESEAYYWYRDTVGGVDVVSCALMALEKWFYDCLEREESVEAIIRQVLLTSRSTALLGVLVAVGRKHPQLFKDELRDLIPIWELQVWEENYRIHSYESEFLLGMTMMHWTRWGESIWNMVHGWHMLEHRKTTLSDVLFELFLTDNEMQIQLADALVQWNDQLKKLDGSGDALQLEKISLRFDNGNWRTRKVENEFELHFVEPEERTQRLAPDREVNERRKEILGFPFLCRQLIDNQKEMSDEELDLFWQRLKKIGDDVTTVVEEPTGHAILGGIAVLYTLHKDWVDAKQEREKWLLEQFSKVLENPPPRAQFHVAESISNYHWDNFAAMILPAWLAEVPSNAAIRSLCAEFALAFNFSVIQDLMTFAFRHRDRLRADFDRLQHLVLVSSGMRNVEIVTHGGNSYWNSPGIEFDIDTQLDQMIEAFVDESLPTEFSDLSKIAESATNEISKMVRQQHAIDNRKPWSNETETHITAKIKRSQGFEPAHLRAAFNWLDQIEVEVDQHERDQWLSKIENLLRAFLRPLGSTKEALLDEENNSFFRTPTEWDSWIFDLIATTIPKLNNNESGRRLWEPILSMGLDRINWVDSFLSAWFVHGLKIQDGEDAFFREWKEMIAYAWARDNWQHTEVNTHHSNDELFCHLMGFSIGDGFVKDKKYRPFIADMKPEYDRWIEEFSPHPQATRYYACFLTFPSASDHLRDGIRRLADTVDNFQEWHWKDFYHLERSLLDLLEHDWHLNSLLIKSDKEISLQFSKILKTMLDRQIPRALELQDQVVRSS